MLVNNGILAFVYWKCLHVEFDNRVGLECWKLQITLERFHTLVIVLNEHNIRNLRPPIKIIT